MSLATVFERPLARYALDIIEVYIGFFAVVAALAPTASTLYMIDFFMSLAAFTIYTVRVFTSPRPLAYLARSSWELPSMVPLLVADMDPRLALIARCARLARVVLLVGYGSEIARLLKGFIRSFALSPIFLLFATTLIVGSLTYYAVEAGKSVKSYIDALWFTLVTITTVGYGDVVPVTGAGKAVTMVLMVTGIILWSVTVAMFTMAAARSIGRLLLRELHRIERRRLKRLEAVAVPPTYEYAVSEDALTACMVAALSLPPDEFEEFIKELRRRYRALHGITS